MDEYKVAFVYVWLLRHQHNGFLKFFLIDFVGLLFFDLHCNTVNHIFSYPRFLLSFLLSKWSSKDITIKKKYQGYYLVYHLSKIEPYHLYHYYELCLLISAILHVKNSVIKISTLSIVAKIASPSDNFDEIFWFTEERTILINRNFYFILLLCNDDIVVE